MNIESIDLYSPASKLRSLARMFLGNGDTERPAIAFNADEQSGLSSLLVSIADEIDDIRDGEAIRRR
jgi:hypothetical protein